MRGQRLLPFMMMTLVAPVFFAACGDNGHPVPTAPAAATAPSAVNASAQCYNVRFQATWASDNGSNVTTFNLTGDLVGTLTTTFDLATTKYSGPMPFLSGGTVALDGTGAWTLTGGTVPDLTTFQTALRNRNQLIYNPQSPAYRFENIGTHRALSGVAKANLSYKGIAEYGVGPTVVDHQYWGVICP